MSDIQLEVSFPENQIPKSENPLILIDLLKDRKTSPIWTEKEHFEILNYIKTKQINNENYTLLRGDISHKLDESYEVRSFLIIESLFVKNNNIKEKLREIENQTFDWDDDIYLHGTISKTYFGELYWADSIPDLKFTDEEIPTGKTFEKEIKLTLRDVITHPEFKKNKAGDTIKRQIPEKILIQASPTLKEYLWESKSDIYPTINDFIPSPNIGKQMGFKSDPKNFKILDSNCRSVFIKEIYQPDKNISQEFYYLRTDILDEYLGKNNLIILYQNKQHSYDRISENNPPDFRGLKFCL